MKKIMLYAIALSVMTAAHAENKRVEHKGVSEFVKKTAEAGRESYSRFSSIFGKFIRTVAEKEAMRKKAKSHDKK